MPCRSVPGGRDLPPAPATAPDRLRARWWRQPRRGADRLSDGGSRPLQALSIARNHRFETERHTFAEQVELTILPGVDPGSLRRNDFSRSADLMARGHAAAAAHLDDLAAAANA